MGLDENDLISDEESFQISVEESKSVAIKILKKIHDDDNIENPVPVLILALIIAANALAKDQNVFDLEQMNGFVELLWKRFR